ncbi:LAME_0D04588g1_1 [Lachancea meyersii CBS 8951]|uniref:LAME_0D04588g1_1 n=1 Tax=Lachancea meyersii CBS 8951 TaxID=1266667 RepID=A0A1G4J8W0_9SACH|nr:LAME_0D04588g1_1 [Lachancea meyersii CBS 8951]
MEHLNSLEKSLPPEGPVNDQNIDKVNRQVTQEFKIAANAVTNLYRLSSERSSLNRHMGYVDCLGDVLELIEKGYSTCELAKWCEERKQEKSGQKNGQNGQNDVVDTTKAKPLAENKENSVYGRLPVLESTQTPVTSPTFRLSRPIMSVERAPRRCVKPELTERFLQQREGSLGERRSKKKRMKKDDNAREP